MIQRLFAIAGVFTLFYGVALALAFVLALRRRSAAAARRKAMDAALPDVAAAVVDFAAGSNDPTRIRQFTRSHRDLLENCLLQYHATMSGDGRNRLAELALDIGLVHRWCEEAASRAPVKRRVALARLAMVAEHEPSRRISVEILHKGLKDTDEYARLEAARTLIHTGDEDDLAEIFRAAVRHSLLVRLILADELRHHVLTLCRSAVPEALRSGSTAEVAAALEMLAAWERAVPLSEVARLARHADRNIRLQALRVLPLTPAGPESAYAIECALADADEEICLAGATAAGRMRLESTMVPLARCLRTGKLDLARASASALAMLAPRGWETLAELSGYADPITASAAVEALERARKNAGLM
jgi:hypothetical protein